ncbi:leucine-rich repeat-containing protein 56 isoform X2 [Pogona vitticeps]
MEVNWKLDRVSRPGSATVRVTDLGWQGLLNPSPFIKDEEELFVDKYLSPAKLKTLTGLDDLHQVKALEMRVDTRENSLGNFGTCLPNLKRLKLNNSVLTSVRDLGTALSSLQVLWMARCRLPDLDGIASCCSLKELYIAYNNIADLSELSLLEHLEILDLEGNNIEDLNQIQYLGLCPKLTTLTLEGNLVCWKPNPQSSEVPDYNYRAEVKKLIPHLKCLDDIPAHKTALPFPHKMNKDWFIVKESIKEGGLLEETSISDLGSATRWPSAAMRTASAQLSLTSRPQTAQRPPSAHLLSSCSTLLETSIGEEMLPEDDASDLTHGVSRVICGNPIKALHARRQKLGPAVMNLFQSPCHSTEHSHDFEGTSSVNGEDIFDELTVSREHHYQHLQALQRETSLQVLKVKHNEEEQEDHTLNDSCDEDLKETIQEDIVKITSSHSSCQSSSDSLHVLENVLPIIAKPFLIPSPPKCPSPASGQGMTAGPFRARHLKVPGSKKQALLKPESPSVVNRDTVQHVVEKTTMLHLQGKADASSFLGQRHRTCGIDTKHWKPILGPTKDRTGVNRSLHIAVDTYQPVVHSHTKTSERLGLLNVVRPLTAKAALQSLPNRPDISVTSQSKTPKL